MKTRERITDRDKRFSFRVFRVLDSVGEGTGAA